MSFLIQSTCASSFHLAGYSHWSCLIIPVVDWRSAGVALLTRCSGHRHHRVAVLHTFMPLLAANNAVVWPAGLCWCAYPFPGKRLIDAPDLLSPHHRRGRHCADLPGAIGRWLLLTPLPESGNTLLAWWVALTFIGSGCSGAARRSRKKRAFGKPNWKKLPACLGASRCPTLRQIFR